MVYAIISLILFSTLQLFIFIAKKTRIIDIPNHRSSHKNITIRGGGIIFPISVLLIPFIINFQNYFFLIGLILISTISFIDDIKPLSVKIRFSFQLAAIILMLVDIGPNYIPFWIWPILIIAIAGVINAFNFMDGINGITGTYSLSIIISIWVINTYLLFFIDNELLITVSISILIFLFYNFRKKAICFAGDIGSVSISYILIFIIIKLIVILDNPIFIVFFAVYGIDSTLTIIIRLKNKENIFEAHRKHLYQLFSNELKVPHIIISSIYALIQFSICGIIIYMVKNIDSQLMIWLITLGILLILTSGYFYIRNRITTRFS